MRHAFVEIIATTCAFGLALAFSAMVWLGSLDEFRRIVRLFLV